MVVVTSFDFALKMRSVLDVHPASPLACTMMRCGPFPTACLNPPLPSLSTHMWVRPYRELHQVSSRRMVGQGCSCRCSVGSHGSKKSVPLLYDMRLLIYVPFVFMFLYRKPISLSTWCKVLLPPAKSYLDLSSARRDCSVGYS